MRDITKDLKQRISEIDVEIARAQKHLDDLINRQRSLKVLAEAEESRWRTESPTLFTDLTPSLSRNSKTLPPFSQFLLASLKDGGKTVEALKREVANNNVSITASRPGRGIAVALVGLSHKGLTEKKDGIWRLKDRNNGSGETSQ